MLFGVVVPALSLLNVSPLQGVFGAVSVAQAQLGVQTGLGTCTTNGKITPSMSRVACENGGGTFSSANPGGNDAVKTSACSLTDSDSWSICISNIVYVFTVGLMSIFAYIAGYLFDFAVQLTLQSNTYAQEFVSIGWTSVRDLANMAFIFILIYIAFTIIFEAETTNTLRMLAVVVLMALLINFSFFFTRVVIDAGNILATQFYNAIDAPTLENTANSSTAVGGTAAAVTNYFSINKNTKDLTANIMQSIHVVDILNSTSFKAFSESPNGGFLVNVITLSMIYVAVGVVFAILAATFLMVGFKFLMRIVILWFVIIASPLAFIARAITTKNGGLKKFYDKWQSLLIEQSFYPAIFLFMFFIINLFMVQLGGQGGIVPDVFNDFVKANSSNTNVFVVLGTAIANVGIRLGLVVIMIYYGLKVADMLVTTGNEAARGFTGWAGRQMGNVTSRVRGGAIGAVGFAGRNTVGAGAYAAAQSATVRGWAANSALGRVAQRGLLGTSRRSFDARAIPGVRTAGGAEFGVPLAEPQKGGYQASMETRAKRREEQVKGVAASDAQIDAAYRQAINQLSTPKKAELERLAKQYADAQENRKDGTATQQEVKEARDEYNAFLNHDDIKVEGAGGKKMTITDRAKEIYGHDNKKDFAEDITTRQFKNLWGTLSSGIPGVISRADQEAAARIRGAKNPAERVRNILAPPPSSPPGWLGRLLRNTGGAVSAGTALGIPTQTEPPTPPPPTPPPVSPITPLAPMAAIVVPTTPTAPPTPAPTATAVPTPPAPPSAQTTTTAVRHPTPPIAMVPVAPPAAPTPTLTSTRNAINLNPPPMRPTMAAKPVDNNFQQVNLMRQQIKISKGMASTLDAIKKKLGAPKTEEEGAPQQPNLSRRQIDKIGAGVAEALNDSRLATRSPNSSPSSRSATVGLTKPQDINITLTPPRTDTTAPPRSNPPAPRSALPPSTDTDNDQKAA